MTSIRKQLADTLRYIRREHLSDYLERESVELFIESITTTCMDTSINRLIEGIDPSDYSNVFVRGGQGEDWDGYKEGYIELYAYRKETDQEYFDRVCQYILPTENQQKQYQDYLRLKSVFEREKE